MAITPKYVENVATFYDYLCVTALEMIQFLSNVTYSSDDKDINKNNLGRWGSAESLICVIVRTLLTKMHSHFISVISFITCWLFILQSFKLMNRKKCSIIITSSFVKVK